MRCEYCYVSRLEKVFEYAKENGYTHVTTTLLISPYQKHDLIISVCNKLAEKYGVKFMYNANADTAEILDFLVSEDEKTYYTFSTKRFSCWTKC